MKQTLQRLAKWLAVPLMAAGLAACGSDDHKNETPAPTLNIVQTAANVSDFSTLVAAVQSAQLVNTLSGPGPFTVFAPTNAAFADLLSSLGLTSAQLLDPANRPLLTAILTYHVLPAQVLRAQVPTGSAITTVQGGTFTVAANGNALTITDALGRTANITATDTRTTNGVIHTIDRVILPQGVLTIAQTARVIPGFSTLLAAVGTSTAVGARLTGTAPTTVFAPTDTAFTNLLTSLGLTPAQLLASPALVQQILLYHALDGQVLRTQVPTNTAITTLQGGTFTVAAAGTGLRITDALTRQINITATDIRASNGVIHVVDTVLLPQGQLNIAQTASVIPAFSTLRAAVGAAAPAVATALTGTAPLTVFAPTNDAFANLLTELGVTQQALLANQSLLTTVLQYHVVNGQVLRAQVPLNTAITTLQGQTFRVAANGNTLTITDARNRTSDIVLTDVRASNGVIHVISPRVILPAP
ncbi:fasciclin domain-containing protein [Piscinibacterium candidicorallinum]|uniref:Fasciclin domain-containing protein n=1 Tax=Piscinibacterium candidicorallinum TaxID=1793872 RepID=A0ABV7H652_9BURK